MQKLWQSRGETLKLCHPRFLDPDHKQLKSWWEQVSSVASPHRQESVKETEVQIEDCVARLPGAWGSPDPVPGFPNGSAGKNPPAVPEAHEMWIQSLDQEISWRRAWQPTPVFLPGESHGQRTLVDYRPQCHKELDTTEATQQTYTWTQCPGCLKTGVSEALQSALVLLANSGLGCVQQNPFPYC